MALGLSPTEIVAKGQYELLVKAEHWERVFLADVAEVQNGYAFKSEFFDREKGVPLIRIRDISKSETEHKYRGEYEAQYAINNGDILIGMDGDFLAARWKGDTALLNQRVCKLTMTRRHYDEKFFFHCLQPYLNAINAETSSVTVKHLSSKTLEVIPLPLPPLGEQRRIVAKLDELFSELDKGIESLKTARGQLKVYRQAVLKHAFEGKLTAQWREETKDKLETPDELLARIKREREARYEQQIDGWKYAVEQWQAAGKAGRKPARPKAPRKLSQTALQPLGTRLWPEIELGDVISVSSGQGLTASGMSGGAYPVYGGNGICGHHNDYIFEDPILIVGRVGAKCGVTHITKPQSWVTDNALIVSPLVESFDQRFFRALLEFLNLNTLGSSTGQPVISGSKIYPVLISMPPYDEQVAVADRLEKLQSTIDTMSAEIDAQLMRCGAFRHSILKRTFSGHLVAQDPKDEPASVLLERIKAEKADQGNKKKNTKKNTKRKDAA